jgi:alkanesulfonate monooxygenase SsuD/methylene tetrahydromethanopterin reductase-like flavin-dependent oxidoreductase (luciferase family)
MVSAPNAGDPATLVELAVLAERHGWHGFALWDHLQFTVEMQLDLHDPFTVLGAAAHATERISLGTLVTPLARRQPWEVAKQLVTLDHLSRGRAFLGVGLGEPPDADFAAFGLDDDAVVRAERLDEALDLVGDLIAGKAVGHSGRHWQVAAQLKPPSVQRPRPPVYVAGVWPHRRPLLRAARWDGYCPIGVDEPVTAEATTAAVSQLAEAGAPIDAGFEVFAFAFPGGPSPQEYADAGATWIVASVWPESGWQDDLRAQILEGPYAAT